MDQVSPVATFSARAAMPGIVVAVLLASPAFLFSAPVEGDKGLLVQLYEVQRTNEAQYEKARLRAHVVLEGTMQADLDVEFLWDRFGERRYWKYSGNSRGGANDFADIEMIRTHECLMTYNPGGRHARQTSHRRTMDGYAMSLKLHPTERWFVFDMGQQPMHELLDPDASNPGLSYIVRRDSGDRVIVERHRDGRKAREFTASLTHGGNIIQVETIPDWAESTGAYVRNASYEWVADGQGGWYPREIVLKHSHPDDPDTPFWSMRVEIVEFDPLPVIPQDRFEFSSLALPDGTRVGINDEKGERVQGWVIGREEGEPQREADQGRLDELADELRNSGFAAPERER